MERRICGVTITDEISSEELRLKCGVRVTWRRKCTQPTAREPLEFVAIIWLLIWHHLAAMETNSARENNMVSDELAPSKMSAATTGQKVKRKDIRQAQHGILSRLSSPSAAS